MREPRAIIVIKGKGYRIVKRRFLHRKDGRTKSLLFFAFVLYIPNSIPYYDVIEIKKKRK
jgi:hypothetical protein